MKVRFQQADLELEELTVIVESSAKTARVDRLLNYLKAFESNPAEKLPIKTPDRFMIIKTADLVMVEVNQNELSFYTTAQVIKSVGKLKDVHTRLTAPNFIQVSRFAIINMDYLQAIENGFSGTLVARLETGVRTTVSRRYVPVIKQYLGL